MPHNFEQGRQGADRDHKTRGVRGRPPHPHPDYLNAHSLAEQIKRLRQRKNWTQHELALAAKLGRTVVLAAEQRGQATEHTVNRLAEALQVTPKELCGHSLAENNNESLYNFGQVCDLFLDWEDSQCNREGRDQTRLDMDLLFIEMVEGWEFLMRVTQRVQSTRVHFRILMLDGPSAILHLTEPDGPARQKTLVWSDTAAVRRESLIAMFKRNPFTGLGKTVTAAICVYQAVPTVQGIRAAKGDSVRIAVSRCSLPPDQPLNYVWGNKHRFYSSEEANFDEQTREWQERFRTLWTPAGVKYDDTTEVG